MINILKQLIKRVDYIDKYLFYKKRRYIYGYIDFFTWVYGLSREEIKDFSDLYLSSRQEIKNIIENIRNEKLKVKLIKEYDCLPIFDKKEFVIENFLSSLIFKFIPFKTMVKTFKFKRILKDIRLTTERMINYIENSEWLEIEK